MCLVEGAGCMRGSHFAFWLADLSATVVGVLSGSTPGSKRLAERGTAQNATASLPNRDLVRALQATGPLPSLRDHANVFGRFVGTRDVEYDLFMKGDKAQVHVQF